MKKLFIPPFLLMLLTLSLFGRKVLAQGLEAPTPTPDVLVGAPPEYLYPGLLPDHPLYFLKDLYYRLRTKLVFGFSNQARWYLKLTDKRAAEARELARKGKLELATQASQRAAQMYSQAVERLKKLGSGASPELVENFRKVSQRQGVVLEGVFERVPPEAKQTVIEALESSRQSLEQGLAAVGEKLTELSSSEKTTPEPTNKIDEVLFTQIESDPDQTFEIQIRLSRSLTEEDKLELEELLKVSVYTERQAVGEAGGDEIKEIADLPYVSRISLLPTATEGEG